MCQGEIVQPGVNLEVWMDMNQVGVIMACIEKNPP
jgi:sugar diacid utilization regulator